MPHALSTAVHAPVTLRAADPSDQPAMQAFVLGLSPASRRLRFHGAVNGASPELLRCLTQSGGPRRVALVACVAAAGGDEIVGQACCAPAADPGGAEFALVVADAWQGRGLAGRLLRALLAAAAANGADELTGEVLAGNPRMQALLQREGFVPDGDGAEPGVQRWRRALHAAAPRHAPRRPALPPQEAWWRRLRAARPLQAA